MITLDASLVIAHLQSHDPNHLAATRLLRERAGEPFLMHGINLAEVLVGGVRVGRGRELLADLVAIGVQVADRDEQEPMRLAVHRAETGLKLPECCALDVALASQSTLGTLDARLAAVARSRHLEVVPA